MGVVIPIDEFSPQGEGIGYINGVPVHVAGALPDEVVDVDIYQTGQHFARASLKNILHSSVNRVNLFCEYADRCGGCRLQYATPTWQCQIKQHWLSQALHKAHITPDSWLPAITGPDLGYRRRVRLAVRQLANHGMVIGFRARGHSHILDIQQCPVLEPRLQALLPPLREVLLTLSVIHRLPQVELVSGDEQVACVIRHLLPLSNADKQRLREFGERYGCQVLSQAAGPESIIALTDSALTQLVYQLSDSVQLSFLPTDFIQANACVNRQLVQQVIACLEPQEIDRVADLFCGIGNFSLPIARHVAQVVAADSHPGLVQRAEDNGQRNALANVRWMTVDLQDPSASLLKQLGNCNKMIIDPPREGAIALLKAIGELHLQRLIYISCDIDSFTRDASYLVHRGGWELQQIGIADMFVHTLHTEVMACFVKHQ